MTIKALSSYITLLLLLITMAIVQMHLKEIPTIILCVFTFLTIITSIFKKDKLANVLLLILISLSAFFFWFLIFTKLKDLISPPVFHGHFVMDMTWLYFIPVGVILSVLTTFLYFKKTSRYKKFEQLSLTLYFIASVIISFRYILFW